MRVRKLHSSCDNCNRQHQTKSSPKGQRPRERTRRRQASRSPLPALRPLPSPCDPGQHGGEVQEARRYVHGQPKSPTKPNGFLQPQLPPVDTPFKQQKLKAWQPILTPNWVIGTFAVVGLIFIPIGIILHTESENVVEYSIQYDGKNTPDSANIAKLGKGCFLESDADRDSFDLASRGCLVSFQIEKDMKGPVFVYYQLDNFYQNHRRYVQSRSDAQLRGDAKASTSDCSPLTEAKNVIKYNSTSSTPLVPTNGTYTVNPCGLIANSLFNGTQRQRLYWIRIGTD
jgi:hypothetical protein